MSARAEPRLTRDADLAVLVTDDRDAEALVRALQGRGWRVTAAIEHEVTARLATVRLVPPGEEALGTVVDLLFASSGIEPEIVTAAEPVAVVPGLALPVARPGHLLALKLLARDDRTRPQDRLDIAALLGQADATALAEAESSLAIVTARGFHRGRDLPAALRAALQEFRG